MADQARLRRIFLASFLTIFANGVCFGVRGSILGDWAEQFSFTKTELGTITGGGLWAFGIVILLSSLFLDKVGYKPILLMAFVLHLLSGVVTLSASAVYASAGKAATFNCLNLGMIMYAVANGLCEAAVNPLVATLYPRQKTHYLNILHASWPGGMIVGGLLAYCFTGWQGGQPVITKLQWEIPFGMFLLPVLVYGLMIAMEKLPESESRAAGVTLGEMLSYLVAPMLLLLIVIHAMVGYVELGTDSWITNIMGNVVKDKAILLFIYTSALMFVLRFFAGPIVERINPLGLLTISALMGFIGLIMLSQANNIGMAFLAGSVYGIGKTFLWPTMLGVAGERYPRGGAIVMGALGGAGMLSAGLLGAPGIGYQQDYFASTNLKEKSEDAYNRYVAKDKNSFLFFAPIAGLDGSKVGVLSDDGKELKRALAIVEKEKRDDKVAEETKSLAKWWQTAKLTAEEDETPVKDAGIFGGRMALHYTAYVPLTMAVLYLILVLYFRAVGGYKAIHIHGEPVGPAEY